MNEQERRDAINGWIVRSVVNALTNDSLTYHQVRGALIQGYRQTGEWDFHAAFQRWLHLTSKGVYEGSPVVVLLHELMDIEDKHLGAELVGVFLDENDRAEIEGSGRD